MRSRWIVLLIVGIIGLTYGAWAEESKKRPSVLIVAWHEKADYDFYKRLNNNGFDINHFTINEKSAFDWDMISKYNCLLFEDLPLSKDTKGIRWNRWNNPPYREEMIELLDRYLAAGGGIFLLPDIRSGVEVITGENLGVYLQRWGAALPLESIHDPSTQTNHQHYDRPFIYTDQIMKTPVSEGVKGIWFPTGKKEPGIAYCFAMLGRPIDVSSEWQVVVRGSDKSFTKNLEAPASTADLSKMVYRPDQSKPPTLMAIREQDKGRLALCVIDPIFHLHAGTSWVHAGVVLDKGLQGRKSDFGRLFENTLKWLSEPSLKSGKLGGYQQDPNVLVHPHFRKKPNEFFNEFDSYQNPTLPARVYRGLVGARTAYSSGKGTVAEYIAAAKRVGLDFVVFLEEFSKFSEEKLRKLEKDCKALSSEEIILIPGYSMKSNIGNHLFFFSADRNEWPTPTQLDGPDKDQLRLQCKDSKGELTWNDEDAKRLLWYYQGGRGNIGYYNFADNAGMPVRDLRLFGILGVMTYIDGKLVEDITPEYLEYAMDSSPPLACAVDIVESPEELEAAVRAGHYLTHVAAMTLKAIPKLMVYGHAYGRGNVNPSQGPKIKSWAGTQRVMTYAGEPFVTARYRFNPRAWVVSDVGLKEIRIYCDTKLYRRILLHGKKMFRRTFKWAYDRHRVLVLEAIDIKGRRAISAGCEVWCDANFIHMCGDRQNTMTDPIIWPGPFPGFGPKYPMFSQGHTWDGGGRESFMGAMVVGNGFLQTKSGEEEGSGYGHGYRWMEGNVYPTCWDDSVANVAGVMEHIYPPGISAFSYNTLGPIFPSKLMTLKMRQTQYLHRVVGPNLDVHAMWPERTGGNIAMFEGTMKLKKDMEISIIDVATMTPLNFATPNVPIWAIRTDNQQVPILGTDLPGVLRGLGVEEQGACSIAPGGYVAMVPTQQGNNTILFNVGDTPLKFSTPGSHFYLPTPEGVSKRGDTFSWKYLVLYDSIKQPAHNLMRIERIREYYGLDGKHDSGITVKRGKIIKHFGLVDLAPEKGVVEFEVPAPEFDLDIPLGLRFIGFNPNWTVGQYQIVGYSPGFYSKGKNVYRNLATDDRDMVHLAVYTTGVPLTHCIVGHPVQCDAKDLIIEVTKLSDEPHQYYVAVNNPTDNPIKTTLRKCIDLPGFEFPDQEVSIPAGGYEVVKK